MTQPSMIKPRLSGVVNFNSLSIHFSLILLCCFFVLVAANNVAAKAVAAQTQNNPLFPRPQAIEPAVQFWTKVYTQISTSEGYIHDNVNLSVIYETIKIPKNLSGKSRARYTKKYKKKI